MEQLLEYKQMLRNVDKYDVKNVLSLSRKIAKRIKDIPNEEGKRIAILANVSTQFFSTVLKSMLYSVEINVDIYEGGYDSIDVDTFNEKSDFYAFNPHIVILLLDHHIVKIYPDLLDSKAEIQKKLDLQVGHFVKIWNTMSEKLPSSYILQSNIVIPLESELGNLEANYAWSKQSYLNAINLSLIQNRLKNVQIVDLEHLASSIGKYHWFDEGSYYLNKFAFSLDYVGVVVWKFINQILALNGKVKKCLVLDLDDTIWGGIVSELGYDQIEIQPTNPIGEAYLAFQKYILSLSKRGIILAVASKNDYHVAIEPFEKNTNMILKKSDFAAFYANWENKASNIEKIAKELNIGLDSIVFFDDNPAEREIVRFILPEVTVIDVPKDPAKYIRALEKDAPFEWNQITREDIQRNKTYSMNKQRVELEQTFDSFDQYLQELKMLAQVERVNLSSVNRVVQLLNKTNQFNLRTVRYTDADIVKYLKDEQYTLFTVTLQDKFSEYGIIAAVILKKEEEECFIESWVMSCRVLKRGLEYFIFEEVLKRARELNCTYVRGEYIPTEKNSIVQKLYHDLKMDELVDGNVYRCKSDMMSKKTHYIKEK